MEVYKGRDLGYMVGSRGSREIPGESVVHMMNPFPETLSSDDQYQVTILGFIQNPTNPRLSLSRVVIPLGYLPLSMSTEETLASITGLDFSVTRFSATVDSFFIEVEGISKGDTLPRLLLRGERLCMGVYPFWETPTRVAPLLGHKLTVIAIYATRISKPKESNIPSWVPHVVRDRSVSLNYLVTIRFERPPGTPPEVADSEFEEQFIFHVGTVYGKKGTTESALEKAVRKAQNLAPEFGIGGVCGLSIHVWFRERKTLDLKAYPFLESTKHFICIPILSGPTVNRNNLNKSCKIVKVVTCVHSDPGVGGTVMRKIGDLHSPLPNGRIPNAKGPSAIPTAPPSEDGTMAVVPYKA